MISNKSFELTTIFRLICIAQGNHGPFAVYGKDCFNEIDLARSDWLEFVSRTLYQTRCVSLVISRHGGRSVGKIVGKVPLGRSIDTICEDTLYCP